LLLSVCTNHLHVVKLDYVDQFIMAYGGLRGAVTFALVVLLDESVYTHRRLMVTTTIVVIYVTNFFLVIVAGSAFFYCCLLLSLKHYNSIHRSHRALYSCKEM